MQVRARQECLRQLTFLGDNKQPKLGYKKDLGEVHEISLAFGERIVGMYGESYEKGSNHGRFKSLGLIVSKFI